MDRKLKRRFYVGKSVTRIIVSEGRVIGIYQDDKKTLPKNKGFYELLEKSLKELVWKSPRQLDELYKSLFFSTREYKLAKRVRENYIASLEDRVKEFKG